MSGVRCDIGTGTMVLSVNTRNLGEAREEVAIDYQGADLSVGFNGRYLFGVPRR